MWKKQMFAQASNYVFRALVQGISLKVLFIYLKSNVKFKIDWQILTESHTPFTDFQWLQIFKILFSMNIEA